MKYEGIRYPWYEGINYLGYEGIRYPGYEGIRYLGYEGGYASVLVVSGHNGYQGINCIDITYISSK